MHRYIQQTRFCDLLKLYYAEKNAFVIVFISVTVWNNNLIETCIQLTSAVSW